jgi:dipeptidyl-peptidase-4
MKGRLLIVHGMIDENVHFRHSARLVASLCDAGKRSGVDYSLLPFPSERHVPRSFADRMYMERCIFSFLREALAPPAPSPA